MRISEMADKLRMADIRAEPGDQIDVRIQPSLISGEQMLYVDVNGITALRIGGIKQEIEVTRS